MLLYVLESKGSSPGRQGFCMAVNEAGEMEGSIGGGIMEHKFVEMAKGRLKNSGSRPGDFLIKKQIHDKSATANQSGMICSGEQVNLLYQLREDDISCVESVVQCMADNRKGTLQLSKQGVSFFDSIKDQELFLFEFTSEDDWVYRETVGYKNTLHIIGAGHCALAFSRIMSMMDFYIHLYDTRTDLHTMIENNYVHQKKILNDYLELNGLISSGPDQFVVVMTFGYRTDKIAVTGLIGKEFRYFGLLGSATKVKKLMSDLKKDGLLQQQLDTIYAPIGLPINSQTPEEIAISIAAEIIQIKNRDLKTTNDPNLRKIFSK